MHTNKLVSIALCTYNGELYLQEQLNTLVKQTYKNIEIVIADDNSTDDTFEIIKEFANRYKFIKFFRNTKNLGFVKNFEKAINECTGDFICLCDQDDVWDSSKVEKLVFHIGNSNLIYHNSNFIDESGATVGSETMASKYNFYHGDSAIPFMLSNCVSGHAMMFSRKLINYFLPLEEKFFHDWWITYVAFNLAEPVIYLDEVLVGYRQHSTSITDNFEIKESSQNVKNRHMINVNLPWLKKCATYKHNKQPLLAKRTFTLFKDFEKGKNRFGLFLFLAKNFDLVIYNPRLRKTFLSKLNYIRKLCYEKNRFYYQ